MIIVALVSSAQGVIIPQVIASFGLSLSEGGLLVALQQSASVVTMLVTGLLVDRFGAVAVLVASAAAIAASALSASLAPTYALVVGFLWLAGIGSSSTAAATNALMAQTGERRAYYLGLMHSTYSLMSIGGPLLAGMIVAVAAWRDFYRLVALVAFVIGWILWRFEGGVIRPPIGEIPKGARARGERLQSGEPATPFVSLMAGWRSMSAIYPLCLGIVFMVGTQASLATWGYSYMLQVYGSSHSHAAMATSLYWSGIFLGRLIAIPLSRRYSERGLLLTGLGLCLAALGADWLSHVAWVAMAALVVAGYGVSGAFQLGTSWAAAVAPGRIAIGSSLIMASASFGSLVLPMMTALFSDHFGFSVFRWLMLAGYLVSAAALAVTPAPNRRVGAASLIQ